MICDDNGTSNVHEYVFILGVWYAQWSFNCAKHPQRTWLKNVIIAFWRNNVIIALRVRCLCVFFFSKTVHVVQ